MAERAEQLEVTVEDYLEGELRSEVRHEFVDGRVYAMAGASAAHNLIALNLASAMLAHLRGGPCQVFMADMKVHVRLLQGKRFYYPDLHVCCDPQDRETYYRNRPALIVEVLSPHTERDDRSTKFYAYRQLDSLQEYILIAQDLPRVEIYRRATGWDLEIFGMEETVRFDSIGFAIAVADIYRSVSFEAAGDPFTH